MEKIQSRIKINETKKQNYDLLFPLYNKLGLSPIKKQYDIVYLISVDLVLCAQVVNALSEVTSREDIYNIVVAAVLPRIISGDYSFRDYALLCRVSNLAYQDKKHWAISNGIPFDEVQNRVYRNHPKSDND